MIVKKSVTLRQALFLLFSSSLNGLFKSVPLCAISRLPLRCLGSADGTSKPAVVFAALERQHRPPCCQCLGATRPLSDQA